MAINVYPTASSPIKDGVDGVIVPLENEGCARGLAEFISDKEKQQRIVDYLKHHDYAYASEVAKIHKLL